MNNNYTSNLNLANNQYTHIDLPIAVDNYSSASDKTVTYADFIKFREILNFGYGDVNQGGKRVTIGGSTAGDTWVDVLKQIETLFEALHQRILALENGSVKLTSIEWESTTASSIEGLNPDWPRIQCNWSDSSVTYVKVGDIGVGVPSTNITKTTAYGTYSGITVTYNGLTSLKYTVIEKSVKSIAWKTTTGSSNAGTPVDISTVKNKITVTYDNNTTAEVDETEINVYKNTTHTTAAGDEWYNTAGKYYILGKYRGHTTENHITWTVNSVTNNYFLGATAKDSFEISDLNEYVASKPSSITVPNTVEPDKWTAWIYPKSWGRPTSAISSLSNAEEVQSFNYDELGVPPGYIGMWVDSTSECTYALTW